MSTPGPDVHAPSCTCREHPYDPSMCVRDARDAYLAENGFTADAYDAPTSTGSLLGWKLEVPNPPSHRRAIRLHDLVHVATGYGTDHAGEGEIAAWQARRGLRGAGAYVAMIVTTNLAIGVAFAPRRIWTAYRVAGGGPSLFRVGVGYETLLDHTVGELRRLLEIPARGMVTRPRGLHALAPRPGGAAPRASGV